MGGSVSSPHRSLLALLVFAAAACRETQVSRSYTGSAACAECHADTHARWLGSHHQLAMQPATAEFVRGDFGGVEFRHHGVTSRFFRRGDAFWVATDGADGALAEFRIAYTFGIDPLQQYLVELPGGRLQALPVAWDTRPAEVGGQRWFHVYGDDAIAHDDVLHWTHPAQNANSMCVECHVTDLQQQVAPDGRSYSSTWQEAGVGCEACHGPGSAHVDWARRTDRDGDPQLTALRDRSGGHWVRSPEDATARRTQAPQDHQLDACAQCHARRTQLRERKLPHEPLLETHLPVLLREGLYFADGQIRDEVYVWGSFVQSRMYHAGVRCSDCHDPHSLQLRAPGNALCAQCHDPARFDTDQHHHHAAAGAGSACVDCHMPARDYMVVDPRRDHSFRIPRPDLTQSIGSPNACNACHHERDAAWAAEVIAGWRGGTPPASHFGSVLHAAREQRPGHREPLAALAEDPAQPAIVRATALELLGARAAGTLRSAAQSADGLLRHTAAAVARELPPAARAELLGPLLADPLRAVRSEAARSLAGIAELPPALQEARAAALSEWIAAQQVLAGQPAAQANLGNLYQELGQPQQAAAAFRRALALEPDYVPARVNLADLHRELGDDAQSLAELQLAARQAPDSAEVRHALGLALVRVGRKQQALAEFAAAARQEPRNARFAFVYAVALQDTGRLPDAVAVLQGALRRHPDDAELLAFLIPLLVESQQLEQARGRAQELATRHPDDPRGAEWLRRLKPR